MPPRPPPERGEWVSRMLSKYVRWKRTVRGGIPCDSGCEGAQVLPGPVGVATSTEGSSRQRETHGQTDPFVCSPRTSPAPSILSNLVLRRGIPQRHGGR